MKSTTKRMLINTDYNNRLMWIVIVAAIGVIIGIAIADGKWFYIGLVVSPLIIWLSIEKPFIFPLGAYVFLLPFDRILAFFDIGQAATLTKFLGFLSILVLSLKGAFEFKLKKPNCASILWILFIIYAVMSAWWSLDPQSTINAIQTIAGLVLLYLVLSSYKFQKSEFAILEWCILAGGILGVIIAIYNAKSMGIVHRQNLISFGGKASGAGTFAVTFLIPIAISIKMMMQQKNYMKKCLFGLIIFGMFYVIILSNSRAAFLGVALIIIVYIFSLKQRISFGIVSIILIIILLASSPMYTEIVLERLGKTVETGGAGRTDIWYVGWKSLEKYWLLGAGYQNFPLALNEYISFVHIDDDDFNLYARAHNIYLQIFVELGIIGITLFVFVIWQHFKVIHPKVTHYDLNIIMLRAAFWAYVVASFFRNDFSTKSFWLLWMLIIMYKRIFDDNVKENNIAIIKGK